MAKLSSRKKLPKSAPRKPYPDFPLFPHATQRWAKKILGKLYYFGPWEDPQRALNRYLSQRDDLYAGRRPRADESEGVTVRELCNRFLTAKQSRVETGEITARTFADYHASCERVMGAFGLQRRVCDLRGDDFEQLRSRLAKTRGPATLGNEIQRVRVLFKFAFDEELVNRPIRYGTSFKRPSRRVLRLARHAKGPRMFEREELLQILGAAGEHLKAMVLLGINCGFGNHDVATLPVSALDLPRRLVNYPRPKTGVQRRCPLWPETVEAIRSSLANRPASKDPGDAGLLFVTKYGQSWAKATSDSPISNELGKVLKRLSIQRLGVNFYALRHTFETIGGEARDQVAVDHIMGHARDDMASVYRERISDERLQEVVGHVRKWLFGDLPH